MFSITTGKDDDFEGPANLQWQLNMTTQAGMTIKNKGIIHQRIEGHTEIANLGNGYMYGDLIIPHTIVNYKDGVPSSLDIFDIKTNYDIISSCRNASINENQNKECAIIPKITYTMVDVEYWKKFKDVKEAKPIVDEIKAIEGASSGMKGVYNNLVKLFGDSKKVVLTKMIIGTGKILELKM